MDRLLQDLRYAFRMMVRNPGFTLVAVLALAIGIGGNTAIFSVMHAALANSIPFRDADRLVDISMTKTGGVQNMEASYPNFVDWRAQAKSFSTMAGYSQNNVLLLVNGESKPLDTASVTGNFFDSLQVLPAQGRFFREGEEVTGAKVVVLSHGLWQGQFGGAPMVGKTITVDGEPNEVVGIAPATFQFAPLATPEIFQLVPNKGVMVTRRNLHWIHAVARMKPGVTVAQAAAEMGSISNALAAQYPTTNANTGARVVPLRDLIVGDIRPILLVLMAAVGFVLLIACVNVANLLLTRANIRQREIAIRTALGATRADLVRQLLTESVVLALMGGVAGVALAVWGVEALLSRIPAEVISTMPYLRTTSVGSVTLAFTAGVSLLSGIVFGLAPAWKLSGDAPQEALKDTGGVSGTGRNRLGLALVTAQVSLSIVMLIGAGLMVKSLLHMLETDPGFRTDHLLAVRTFLPPSYDKKETVIQAAQQMQTALKQLPGVTDIGFSNLIALRGGNTVRMQAEGAPVQSAGEQPEGNVREASPTYFTALGARLLYGRYFAETDDAKAPQVVILNASLAKQLFGTENAVGKRLRYTYRPEEKYREVVGVIANVQENRGLDAGDKPAIYEPFLQSADSEVDFAVRTNGDPGQIAAAARRAVLSVNGAIAIIGIESVEQAIDSSYPTFLRRYPAMLASMFGSIALALAMIGLYGMISYSVSQRTREIGIRMALGAQKSDVLRLFMHQGARVTISGVAIGVVAALIVSRVISGLLFGVRPSDPQTFLVSAALLACMALVAVAVPAYRASRVDPNEALRHE